MKAIASKFVLALSVGLGASAAWVAPTDAHAQGDAMTEMARQRFQEGVKFYDQKQYEQARAAFLQAWALKHHPAVLLNLAQSELRSGHEVDAANHFSQYLRDNTNATALERREAEKGLSAATAKVGEVAITAAAGAEIFIDEQPEGRAPLPGPVYVAPGSHTIEAKLGGETKTAGISVNAGQSTTADLTGAAGTGPATPAAGAAPAPAPTGGAASSGSQPPEADTGDDGLSLSTSDKRYEAVPTWFGRQKVAWIGAGVTGLGIIGGIGFGLGAKNKFDSADETKSEILRAANEDGIDGACVNPSDNPIRPEAYASACQRFQDEKDSGDSMKTLATVSVVVAALAAGGTVAYYFVDRKKLDEEEASAKRTRFRAAVVPVATPHGGAVSVFGQF